jgi:hypothetical protein
MSWIAVSDSMNASRVSSFFQPERFIGAIQITRDVHKHEDFSLKNRRWHFP